MSGSVDIFLRAISTSEWTYSLGLPSSCSFFRFFSYSIAFRGSYFCRFSSFFFYSFFAIALLASLSSPLLSLSMGLGEGYYIFDGFYYSA